MSRWLFVVTAVAIIVAAFIYNRYRVAPEINFTELKLTDLYGHKVTLQQYAGNKTLVGFFATWCGPCLREISQLEVLGTELKAKNVSIVLISDEPIRQLQLFKMRKSVTVTILHAEQSLKALGIHTIPTNYILDNHFKVEKKLVDGSGEKLEKLLGFLR
jgi:thiol-disulfide isomerase/thioredoxin